MIKDNNDDSDDEVEFISDNNNNEVAKLPHLHCHCITHRYSKETRMNYCESCYCWFCDDEVKNCQYWNKHSEYNHADKSRTAQFQKEKERFKNPGKSKKAIKKKSKTLFSFGLKVISPPQSNTNTSVITSNSSSASNDTLNQLIEVPLVPSNEVNDKAHNTQNVDINISGNNTTATINAVTVGADSTTTTLTTTTTTTAITAITATKMKAKTRTKAKTATTATTASTISTTTTTKNTDQPTLITDKTYWAGLKILPGAVEHLLTILKINTDDQTVDIKWNTTLATETLNIEEYEFKPIESVSRKRKATDRYF